MKKELSIDCLLGLAHDNCVRIFIHEEPSLTPQTNAIDELFMWLLDKQVGVQCPVKRES